MARSDATLDSIWRQLDPIWYRLDEHLHAMDRADRAARPRLVEHEAVQAGLLLLKVPALLGYDGTLDWVRRQWGLDRGRAVDLMDLALDDRAPQRLTRRALSA